MHILQIVLRVQTALAARGWSAVVITPRLGIWGHCKLAGVPCVLTRRVPISADSTVPDVPKGITSGYESSGAEFNEFAHSVWSALEVAQGSFPLEATALWGISAADDLVRQFAKQHDLPTLHFELGNVEPKTFADFEGVSVRSRVARCPAILDEYQVTDDEIAKWKADFIGRKLRQHTIPQQKLLQLNRWFLADWLGAFVLRIPQPEPLNFASKLMGKLAYWFRRFDAPPPLIKPAEAYVFLPLQVSTDSNLRLFSDHDNFDAIRIAAQEADRLRCSLVIKPHPAEPDRGLLRRITKLCHEKGYILTSANTAELILGATQVITINSTVGLEARLMGKRVTCLGRSVYEQFSDRQGAVYAMRHLLPFFPFGSEPASHEVADRILAMVRDESARIRTRREKLISSTPP